MLTKILAAIFIISLVTLAIILYRLPSSTLEFIALTLLFLFALSAIGILTFSSLWAREYLLHRQADRRKAEREAHHAKYKVIQDGFGMSHLLNVDTDIIENLSAFPGTHHNGKWEEPHPAAAQAWFALIAKRGVESPTQHLLPPPPSNTPLTFL